MVKSVYDLMTDGYTVGSLWAALLKHMEEEQFTIYRLLPGGKGMYIRDELHMWLKEAAEHTVLAAHAIDPIDEKSNKMSVKALMLGMFMDKISKNRNVYPLQAVQQSNRDAVHLLSLLESNKVLAQLSPQMVHHEIVESLWRDKVRLRALLAKIKRKEKLSEKKQQEPPKEEPRAQKEE